MKTAALWLAAATLAAQPAVIEVDASKTAGALKPIGRFFGYDEPNYTYMKDGRKLLSELAGASPAPVHIRVHNLLTSGDGTPALKWGSTNVYQEDAAGNPRYDWAIIDRIFDTFTGLGLQPLVELGFMPEALSTGPQPYRHDWSPAKPYATVFTGWAYPPRDYTRWSELVFRLATHCAERYGRQAASAWYWEVWNEPNIGYWQGTPEQYYKLYDFAAARLKRALPAARIGGPHSTGPGSDQAAAFLRGFLEHVLRGNNYATGGRGAPLDYIGFHAKGRPQVVSGHVRMGIQHHLRDIQRGFEIVASYPELKDRPVIIGESDPEGCAACSVDLYPQNAYRNGTMYASYTAATFARKHELAARYGINLEGAVTWAFEFEGQPYFHGFRSLATNGIDKPVLNVFRMMGLMGGARVAARSSRAADLDAILAGGVRGGEDIGVFASRAARSLAVMIWNYHDDDLPAPPVPVELNVAGLPSGRVLVHHYRVDSGHSNSYEVWKRMGAPEAPPSAAYKRIEAAGKLQLLDAPAWRTTLQATLAERFSLPRQAVSLIVISW